MYIAGGFDQLTRSPKLRKETSRPDVCEVLAHHRRTAENAFLTTFSFSNPRNSASIEIILGIKYPKVSKVSMSRLLNRLVDGGSKRAQPHTEFSKPTDIKVAQATVPRSPSSPPLEPTIDSRMPIEKDALQVDVPRKLRDLLAELSGLGSDEIEDKAELADIGIDSLMGMELAREISDAFKCSFQWCS